MGRIPSWTCCNPWLSSCPGFPEGWIATWKCKRSKPFPPKLLWVGVVHKATEQNLKQQLKHLRIEHSNTRTQSPTSLTETENDGKEAPSLRFLQIKPQCCWNPQYITYAASNQHHSGNAHWLCVAGMWHGQRKVNTVCSEPRLQRSLMMQDKQMLLKTPQPHYALDFGLIFGHCALRNLYCWQFVLNPPHLVVELPSTA